MPRLSDLTDYNYDPMGSAVPAELPVDKPFKDLKKVYITGEEDLPVKFSDAPVKGDTEAFSNNVDKILNSLFRDDEKRYQLWPEKLVRSGTTAAGRAVTGELPQWAVDPATGDVHTSSQMVEAAQEMSALAGTGGLGGTGGTLNATPSLRPALKHNGKLYKGKPGQEHMDVIPESMYPDFQKKAMSGEDIKEYNFGFINDKGHFLNREDALKYGIDNGLIDPQAGKFGALTSTLFADSSKPGAAIEAMKTANPLFSALEHNVKQISQSKMTGDQWLGTLGNKPGVKPEELQWTGLQDFLNENKGKSVTKAQIEEHLAANKVELKEVTKGEYKPEKVDEKKYWSDLDKNSNHMYNTPYDNLTSSQQSHVRSETLAAQQINPTKYSSYQLPGGENYREMLMTLPDKNPLVKLNAEYKALSDEFLKNKTLTPEKQARWAQVEEEITKLRKEGVDTDAGKYSSSHWDEPNILAHVRMNDRTIEGKKSLHLEEIQSDWHQQGREKGYKTNTTNKAYADYEKDLYARAKEAWYKEAESTNLNNLISKDKLDAIYKNTLGDRLSWEQSRYLGEVEKVKHKQIWDAKVEGEKGVPDAPFKKSWHELALKRMLREASEKGYDRLSWTSGEAQAARYDLSKSIGSLKATPIMDQHGLKYEIRATNPNGTSEVLNSVHTADELPNVVGKEMAKKIIDETEGEKPVNFKGLDLKVGGEGMKGFYDQIIPKAIEKLGKEHGVKVQKHELETNPKGWHITPPSETVSGKWMVKSNDYNSKGFQFATKEEAEANLAQNIAGERTPKQPVHYIDIPQSLKDTATQKGFPLFSAGGYMLLPVVGNPFEDKK